MSDLNIPKKKKVVCYIDQKLIDRAKKLTNNERRKGNIITRSYLLEHALEMLLDERSIK